MATITVIGGGSWGTAIALAVTRSHSKHDVRLWAFESDLVRRMRASRENDVFLPGFKLPDSILITDDLGQAVKGMRQSCTKRKLTGKRKTAIKEAAAYLSRNKKRMRYHEYLAAGLPIASGAVEGACKNLVKDRMERSGMRWTVDGAEAVLKLRAIERSHDMDAYWPFHIQQEQERLYGKRSWKGANEK